MNRQLNIFILSGIVFLLSFAEILFAEDTETVPFDAVRYVHRHVSKPREIDMHIVIIDLNKPGITFKTTESNGDTDGETNLETTLEFVKRYKAQIGINGGFFSRNFLQRLRGICDLSSLAVSDGKHVSPWGNFKDAVNIGPKNEVTFVRPARNDTTGYMTEPPVELYNAHSGNVRLIEKGKILARPGGNATYPQTAVGHTADHRLILFVADGRQPKFSAGMTYEEVAQVLKEFGAVDAIALDGGGSATMVMTEKDGAPKVFNRPSDGSERAVGNNLAVIIENKENGRKGK